MDRSQKPLLLSFHAREQCRYRGSDPEEIEAAARSYSTHWTYDDQRLPKDIKDILGSLLAGEYLQARVLRQDLHQVFQKLGSLVNGEANPAEE